MSNISEFTLNKNNCNNLMFKKLLHQIPQNEQYEIKIQGRNSLLNM